MRRAIWTALAILGAQLAGADSLVCCRIFEIDATPILGNDPASCGKVPDADTSAEAREKRNRATQCALGAQAQGRAFVYTYRELVEPEIDLVVQAVIGARGERLLLKIGTFGAENIRSIEVCASLTVQSDGSLQSAGCSDTHPLIYRLRAVPWAR